MFKRQKSLRLIITAIALVALTAFTFALTTGTFNFGAAPTAAKTEKAAQPLTAGTCDGGSNVDVESNGGTALAGYATVKLAFDAINAGTHTGTIIIEVCANTTEGTTPATLNGSGQGSASYTSINMYPIADGVSISGNPVTGFGVIQLKGADNVTIDGDNPNTGGINRNLTIANTTTATVIANSTIRIATATTVVPSADNDTIKNLILNGNVTGGNLSSITSTTGSSNSSFGIYAGGNGGATATDAPTAITSVTTNSAPSGTTINNLTITNNAINQCARAIVFNGAAATVSAGTLTITNNLIGEQATTLAGIPPYTSPSTTVYTKGIWIAGTTSLTLTGNALKNILSYVGTTMNGIELNTAIGAGTIAINNNTVNGLVNNGTTSGVQGIALSSAASGATFTINGNTVTNLQTLAGSTIVGIQASSSATSGTIQKNRVSTVYSRGSGGFGSYGINLAAGNAITVQNNFVWDINAFLNNSAISSSFGPHGIRIASGLNHKIYHNSVYLSGAHVGSSSTSLSSAFTITVTTLTGIDARNNIFANTMTGAFSSSTPVVAMWLPSGGTSAMNLTLNNNTYRQGSGTGAAIAQVGTTSGTGVYLDTNFNAGATTPATNLRSYTSTLSAAGTNDNASRVDDPQFVSTTDLHIQTTSPVESQGANLSVADDIDGDARGSTPDFGADEVTIIAPGNLQFSSSTYGGAEGANVTLIVNRVGGSSGTVGGDVTFTNGTAIGGAVCGAGVDFVNTTQPVSFGNGVTTQNVMVQLCTDVDFDNGETFTAAVGNFTGGAGGGTPTTTTVTITNVAPAFGGNVNVGASENYTSLTNPGGIFEAINNSGAIANITISLTSDLTGETGTVALNEIAGGYTVLIKPSGAPRSITGSSTVSLIKLNGADGVRIDGSTAASFAETRDDETADNVVGGTPALRQLTISNTSTGAVIWIATNATGGATNNTIRNTVLSGGGAFTGQGIIAGSGTTFGAAAENGRANSNNTINNNRITRVQNALFTSGDATTRDQNWSVTENDVGSATVADKLSFRGFLIQGADNFTISQNNISGINSSTGTSSTMSGIQIAGVISGGAITRNQIKDIRQNNTTGWGSNGIYLASSSTGANLTVANNMISDVASQGFAGNEVADNGYGIAIELGGGYKIYHNTVVMNTNQVAAGGLPAAILMDETAVVAGGTDLRNNILAMTATVGTNYAIFVDDAGATDFSAINYNDYFTTEHVGSLAGTNRTTLANWQAATGSDGNSKADDPLFVSLTDFHLTIPSTMVGTGDGTTGITDDYDADPRPASNPDIGADELVQSQAGVLPAGTYYNAIGAGGVVMGGNITITGSFRFTGGILDGNGNTLTIGCNATVSGGSITNYLDGTMTKQFCGTGSFTFDIGTEADNALVGNPPEYSPFTANVTALGTNPSSLSVTAVDAMMGGTFPAHTASRYWDVTEVGDLTADISYTYLNQDVNGDETTYKVLRREAGITATYPGGTVNGGTNTASAPGVTNFSQWGAGNLAPTAAAVNVGGRVMNATGTQGLPRVKVVLSGGDLAVPVERLTNPFGYYSFENLTVGQTYVITVGSKQYTFAAPSRVITPDDNIFNVDFFADWQ